MDVTILLPIVTVIASVLLVALPYIDRWLLRRRASKP